MHRSVPVSPAIGGQLVAPGGCDERPQAKLTDGWRVVRHHVAIGGDNHVDAVGDEFENAMAKRDNGVRRRSGVDVKIDGQPARGVHHMPELGHESRTFGADLDLAVDGHIPLGAAAHGDVVGTKRDSDLLTACSGKHAVEGGNGELALGAADVVVGKDRPRRALDADEGQLARNGLSIFRITNVEAEKATVVPIGRDSWLLLRG
jgi:hypothetical protein